MTVDEIKDRVGYGTRAFSLCKDNQITAITYGELKFLIEEIERIKNAPKFMEFAKQEVIKSACGIQVLQEKELFLRLEELFFTGAKIGAHLSVLKCIEIAEDPPLSISDAIKQEFNL